MPAAKKPIRSRATRPPGSSTGPAPHLVEPTLTRVTARSLRAFEEAVARGFQEPVRPEVLEHDRKISERDRFFGFAVGSRWIATCSAFTRTMTVPGGAAVPVAAVTNVTVQSPFRRRGLLRRMMQHQLEDITTRGEPLATLWASESGIYGRFGYAPAASRSRLSGISARLQFLPGIVPSGSVDEVDREKFLAAAAPLQTALRHLRPGNLDRPGAWWENVLFDAEFVRDDASALRFLLHFDDVGDVDGYATYRFKGDYTAAGPNGEVRIEELEAADIRAQAGLWRYLLEVDLARTFVQRNAPVDAPLRHLVTDARAITTQISDNIYLRVVDVAAALAARTYRTDLDVVLQVVDPLLPANNGRFRLRGGPAGASVTRARGGADLELGILELGAVYLGGVSFEHLQRCGRIREHTVGAAAATSLAFGSDLAPWCPDHF